MTAPGDTDAPAGGLHTEASILSMLSQFAAMQVVLSGTAVIRNKVVAWRLGPSAFGELSQIATATSAIATLVCFGLAVGISRNAAITGSRQERQGLLANANAIVLILAALACGASALLLFTGRLLPAVGLAESRLAVAAAAIFVAGLPIEALKNNYLAFLQGLLDVKGLAARRSLAVLLATAVAIPLVWMFGFVGAAIQYVLLGALVAALLGSRCRQLGYAPVRMGIERSVMLRLASFGVVSLASGLAQSLGDTAVRASLIRAVGAAGNGLLQAPYVLSQTVKGIVLASIGSISLATIAGQKSRDEMSAAVDKLLNVVVPVGTSALGLLGLLGPHALALLYSGSFAPGAELFPFLLGADLLMVFVWVIGAPLLVFGDRVLWLALDLLFALLRWGFGVALLEREGTRAVAMGYLGAACVHAALNLAVFGLRYRLRLGRMHLFRLAAGMALVTACAVIGSRGRPAALVLLAGAAWLAYSAAFARRTGLLAELQRRIGGWLGRRA